MSVDVVEKGAIELCLSCKWNDKNMNHEICNSAMLLCGQVVTLLWMQPS